MRSTVFAAAAALALLLVQSPGAAAQEDAAKPPANAQSSYPHIPPTKGLPKAPVPYTKLSPKPAKPKSASSSTATSAKPTTPKAPTAGAAPQPAQPKLPPVAAPTPTPEQAPPSEVENAPPSAPTESTAPPATANTAAAPPVAAAPRARLAVGQPIPAAELDAFVDGLVKDAMSREHIAGATVSVVQNGQVLLKKGYGFANLEPDRPVDPDRTLFRVGSISKTFTWIALMKEVEAGRMRLNQPVNLYLPEKVQIRDQGFDQPVRVANLMDHSPGFEDRALGQLFERDYSRVRPLDVYLRQERPRRVRPPGVLSSYSNYGAALGGLAVSYAAGKPFERLVEDEILVPLGMSHTTFREPHEPKAGLPEPMPTALAGEISDGYRWTPVGFARRDFEFIGQIAPAGAASSTAGDMARYMLMQLGNGQSGGVTIYGPVAAQAFRTPLRQTPPGINGWAHGFMVFDLPGGHRGYGHGGATLSFFSNMVVVPDLNLGVFISTNTDTGRPLVSRLPDRIVQHFYAGPEVFPRPGAPELAQRRDSFAGYYLTTRRTYSGLEGFIGQLTGGATVNVTRGGRLVTAASDGVKTWVPEGPLDDGKFIATQGAERIAFDMVDGGAHAFHVANGTQVFERAPIWRYPRTLAILAALTAAASLATLGGVVVRNRREFRENQVQSRGSLVQNIQAVLWLLALALFGLWASKTGDQAQVMYRWPGVLMITASACALVAAALTVTTFVALPAIWRGGRRVDSWTHLRKAYFSVTVLIYAAFSIVLALWGALSPWS